MLFYIKSSILIIELLMKIHMKKSLLVLFIANITFLIACQPPVAPDTTQSSDTESMWAINFKTNNYYQLNVQELYTGEKCIIYGETGGKVTQATAKNCADIFDSKIYPMMVNNFCETNFPVGKVTYATTLDYSYSLAKNQDKLIILMLDIKDNYSGKAGDGYVAGYFDLTNLYNYNVSNLKSMIYVDTNPGLSNQEEMYETMAHELQHLINYVTSIRLRPNPGASSQNPFPLRMDTWIDEGLSTMAEFLYRGTPDGARIDWFNNDSQGTIAQGNNFYVWDNYDAASYPNAILDEYATVYLFFQWLYYQAPSGPAMLKQIISSNYSDWRAVTGEASQINTEWNDWGTLLQTWMAANYMNNTTGIYGYKNKLPAVLHISTIQNAGGQKSLYPGEGVYSAIKTSFTLPGNGSGDNIRYAGLTKGANTVSATGTTFNGSALLTYNINTVKATVNNTETGVAETGYLTGQPASTVTRITGRSITNSPYPLIIDAQDLMRRNRGNFPDTEALNAAHEN